MCKYLHTMVRSATFVKPKAENDMTRNFPTFNGPKFVQGQTEFVFLMAHPKKPMFIYKVGCAIAGSAMADFEKKSAMIQEWFDTQFNYREMMKFINRQLGGKLSGESKTTMSLYSTLKSGYRVRVSDHSAFCRRSQSDVYIRLGGRTGAPTISINEMVLDINWSAAMVDVKSLYQSVCDKVVAEIESLNFNN
jgi:hypothetical protein